MRPVNCLSIVISILQFIKITGPDEFILLIQSVNDRLLILTQAASLETTIAVIHSILQVAIATYFNFVSFSLKGCCAGNTADAALMGLENVKMTKIDCIVAEANRLGESPVWSVAEQRLYWVDSRGPAVFRLDPVTGTVDRRALPEIVGSICLRRGGGLVAALQSGLHFFDFDADVLTLIADPEADQPENRFNDGRCDRRGRFWSGTMNDTRREPTGSLYRLDADKLVTFIRDDIIVPNSICWSPDDSIMYFADTYRDQLMCYRFDVDAGEIHDLVMIADTKNVTGRPDGSTVDAEGFLWNAMFGGGRLVRYAPDGRIDREVALPITQPTSCAFGGADLRTLYVTSATQRMTEAELAAQPFAGGVFALDVGVAGLPEPEFAG
jgi:L-arabinonolactonase